MTRMQTAWVTLISSMLWSCAIVTWCYAVWTCVLTRRWNRGVERAMAAVRGSPRNFGDLSDVLCLEQETKIEIAAAAGTKGEIT